MEDVNISKFRAQVVRSGSTPASPGFVVSEGQDPVNPSGSSNYVPYSGAISNVDFGEFGLDTGFVTLDTTPTNIPTEQGGIYWDDSRSTAALIMNGTLQHIGQDTFFYVKNSTGSSIPKGTAVRFNGTDGASGHLKIAPFLANGTYPSNYFMGVTAEVIANGEFGQVMHFGELTGVNTSGYTAGALLYASTSVAGAFQTTAPVAPNNIVLVAAAINSTNNGTILVRPTYGSNINQDEGVKITSVANLNLLQYQSGTGLWENKSVATVMSNYVTLDGTQTISGAKTFTTATKFDAYIRLKHDINLDHISGYSTIGSDANNFFLAASSSKYAVLNVGNLTSQQTYTFPNASGTIALVGGAGVGTVTSVAALTLGTSGTDLSSTVANGTTTPVITLNVPTASASNRGALSAADWTTFNNKQNALTNPVTGTGTTNYLPKFTGSTTVGNSQIFDTGSEVRIFTTSTDARNFTLGVYGVTWDNTLLEIANEVSVFNKTSADNGDIIGFRTVGLQRGDIRASATDFTISSRTNLILGSNNTGQMTLNASGNLLVGTTTDAGFKLDVNGTGRFSSSLTGTQFIASGGNNTTVFNSTSATTGWVQIGMNNTSGSALLGVENSSGGTLATGTSAYSTVLRNYTNTDLQIATNNIVRTTITSGGNVGIGTASPTLPIANRTGLVIRGGSNGAELNLQSTSATDGTSVGFALVGFSTDAFYINRLDGNHIFVTGSGGNTERMRITSGGSVGINNTSPMNSAWGTDITTKQLSIDASAYAVINLTGSTSRKYSMGVGDGNFYMCYDNTAARHNITVSSGGNVLINTTTSGASKLRIVGLPTSSAGLSSGDVWSDSGTLKIA
jgi:hypothetical protein